MITRRSFIGLLGGSIFAAAVPWSPAYTPVGVVQAPRQIGRLRELVVMSGDQTVYASLSRVGAASPLNQFVMPSHGVYRWVAAPGEEIIMPEGAPSIVLDAPGCDWSMIWEDSLGYVRSTNSNGDGAMLQTPEMRLRENSNRLRLTHRGSGSFARYVEADRQIQESL